MKVDYRKIRDPNEEYFYLWNAYRDCGDFFVWDVHPNVIRANEIQERKILRKMKELVDSAEFLDYNPEFRKKL